MSTDSPTLDVKIRLIEAAEEVFAEKGFKSATIREIVEKAGANIAAVNYHFGDKEQLYIETCKQALRSTAFPGPPPSWKPGMRPQAKLASFIRLVSENMAKPASPVAMQL